MEPSPKDLIRASFAEAFDASGSLVGALADVVGPTVRSLVAFHMDRIEAESHGQSVSNFEAADIISDAHAAIATHAKASLEHSAIPQGSGARGELMLGVTRVEAACQSVIAACAETIAAAFREYRDQIAMSHSRRDFNTAVGARRSPRKAGAVHHQRPSIIVTSASQAVATAAAAAAAAARDATANDTTAATPLAVLGTVASSKYSLKASQEYIVSKEAPKPKWSDVPSKVAEVIRPPTQAQLQQQQQQQQQQGAAPGGTGAVAARSIRNPFSTAALDKRLQNVVSSIGSMVFESSWDALDKDATVTDRRIATPTKDSRTMNLLRNLSPDRRDYVLYQSAVNKLPLSSRPSSGTTLRDASDPNAAASNGPSTALSSSTDRRTAREVEDIPAAMADFSSAPRVAAMKVLASSSSSTATGALHAPLPLAQSAPAVATLGSAQGTEGSATKWQGTAAPLRSRPHTATAGSTEDRRRKAQAADVSHASTSTAAGAAPAAAAGSFAQHIANVRRSRPASAVVAPTVSALVDSIRGGGGVTMTMTSVAPGKR